MGEKEGNTGGNKSENPLVLAGRLRVAKSVKNLSFLS
jgi:hypothetical protein